ncbi:MAG: transposase, partial [Porticoccaceae bacterium]
MEITAAQFKVIEKLLPLQRGNVKQSNRQVLDAILHVAEQGRKWRALPPKCGNWLSVYARRPRGCRVQPGATRTSGALDCGRSAAGPVLRNEIPAYQNHLGGRQDPGVRTPPGDLGSRFWLAVHGYVVGADPQSV